MYIEYSEFKETKSDYENQAVDRLSYHVSAYYVDEVAKFLAWGWSEGEEGAKYFAEKFGVTGLHLMAFRSDEEFRKELESAKEPCFS
jgi:hypothetical protein